MLTVGITGGIGTGKTTVAKIFEQLGVPVYYADPRSKYLLNHDPDMRRQVEEIFGKDIYPDGILDKKRLSAIIFTDVEKRKALEAISHPAVRNDFLRWVEENKDHPVLLKEAALLFEAGSHAELQKVIVVSAPLDLRIRRVMARENITEEQVMARINSQWPEDKKLARADFIICNDETQLVIPQVIRLHKELLRLSAER